MRKVYLGLSGLLFLAILAQFYFAAVGAFTKPQTDHSFAMHDMNGTIIIPSISVLATIVAAVARAPRKVVGLSILPALLVLVQMLINLVGGHGNDHTTPVGVAILGLHALNGLLIMLVAQLIFLRARALVRGEAAAAAPATAGEVGVTGSTR
jgi:hypothetical protein